MRRGWMLATLAAAGCTAGDNDGAGLIAPPPLPEDRAARFDTATPLKHLVALFTENISSAPSFGTYPRAENLTDEHPFYAAADTPSANNLVTPLDPTQGFAPLNGVDLLLSNPNFLAAGNGTDAANPFR